MTCRLKTVQYKKFKKTFNNYNAICSCHTANKKFWNRKPVKDDQMLACEDSSEFLVVIHSVRDFNFTFHSIPTYTIKRHKKSMCNTPQSHFRIRYTLLSRKNSICKINEHNVAHEYFVVIYCRRRIKNSDPSALQLQERCVLDRLSEAL
ncbi:hypothetical protein Bhyg_08136 [Pseudolycoriella hygida]|uniref:Uncharacterized protein n=1 Tax=Pseudolycoriella hygida TaxID=35572 RepID=A0A9Q0S4I0_9DIPT|nr:hypothetical protein Bhyg_08136 [Pseudolycoriella hygida]